MIQRALMMRMMMVITMTTCQQWVQSRGTKSLLLHHAKLFANDLLFYSTVLTLFAANFVVLLKQEKDERYACHFSSFHTSKPFSVLFSFPIYYVLSSEWSYHLHRILSNITLHCQN